MLNMDLELAAFLSEAKEKVSKREKRKRRPMAPRFRYNITPVTIKKLVFQGYGLGHYSGDNALVGEKNFSHKTFFISYAAPGDVAEIEVEREKKDIIWGKVVRLIESSPLRIDPPCPIYTNCGGCNLQHISYEDEIIFKNEVVRDFASPLLKKWQARGLPQPEIAPVLPSPRRTAYRNHIQIKSNRESRIGFFQRGFKRVVPLPESGCLLLPPEMNQALLALAPHEIIPSNNMRVRQNGRNEVFIKKLKDQDFPLYLEDVVDNITFRIRMDNFFQINRWQLEKWIALILEFAALAGKEKVLDLFCGGGLITLPLAKRALWVKGIEINKRSIEDARSTALANGIENAEFIQADVFQVIAQEAEADVVIIDPPRSGASLELLHWISQSKIKKLIYISCNPATFFRDAEILVNSGALLKRVQPVDMFPMTYHIELVSLFEFDRQ